MTNLLCRCGLDNSQRLEAAEKSRDTAECKTHSCVRKAGVLGEALSKYNSWQVFELKAKINRAIRYEKHTRVYITVIVK